MSFEERSMLGSAVIRATAAGARLDVKLWSQLVDATNSRVGLLLCGHVTASHVSTKGLGAPSCTITRVVVHDG